MQESKTTPKQYRITMGVLIFFTLVGCALFTFGVFFLLEANASSNWPPVQGEVQSVYVKRTRGASNSTQGSYHYEITYTYLVNDKTYSSNRYSLGSGSTASGRYSTDSEARAAAREAYPTASEITVYYNFADPSSAVLDPGANWGTFVPLLMGLIFILGGIVLLFLVRRNYKKQNTIQEQP